jgi:hypothetical protein
MSLVYIGIFTAMMYLTSRSIEEAVFYKTLLDDYRWTLRISSRAVSFLDFAVQRLDTSLLHLENISPEDIVRKEPQLLDDEGFQALAQSQPVWQADGGISQSLSQQENPLLSAQMATTEQQPFLAILDAIELNSPISNQELSEEMVPSRSLDFFGRDWNETGSADIFQALDMPSS